MLLREGSSPDLGTNVSVAKHRKATHLLQQPPLHVAADPRNHRGQATKLEALSALIEGGQTWRA